MNPDFQTALAAILSLLVRNREFRPTGFYDFGEKHGTSHVLVFAGGTRHFGASFTELPDHPELISVRTTNWSAEDEVGGVYKKEDARRMYRKLVTADFVVF